MHRTSSASLPSLASRPSTSGSGVIWSSASAARLMRPLSRAAELDTAQQAEQDAKKMFVGAHRDLLKMARASSTASLFADRKARAVAVRGERYAETGKDLMLKLKSRKAAGEDKVVELSIALNVAMCHLYPQARSQASYFNLFRHMDKDGSGLISYYEFLKMIRSQLGLSERQMGESEVEAMWRWVDEDASGMIGAGEVRRRAYPIAEPLSSSFAGSLVCGVRACVLWSLPTLRCR